MDVLREEVRYALDGDMQQYGTPSAGLQLASPRATYRKQNISRPPAIGALQARLVHRKTTWGVLRPLT